MMMKKKNNKKVLIIGCMGYLGSALSDYLIEKNYKCEGIDTGFFSNCNIYKEKKFKIKKKSASQVNEKDIKDFDVVIQFAAFSNDPYGNLDPKKFYKPTTDYTIKIAKICKKLKKKFIFPSSCSVYGYGVSVFSEESKVSPLTEYSKNKIEIERKLYKITNKDFKPIILRLATVYGLSPRIRFDIVINMLCGMIVSSNQIKLNSNGLAWRPHVNILDVIKIIIKFFDYTIKPKQENIFNIGSNKNNYRIIDVAKIIKKIKPFSKIIFLHKQAKKNKDSLISDKKIQDGVDKRSYKVSFKRIDTLFKKFKFINLDKGIKILIKELNKNKLDNKKFSSINFYRLQKLDQINKIKKIKI